MQYLRMLRGLTALIVILVLGVAALLLAGVPLLRKALWAGVGITAVAAAWNEITGGR